MCFQFWKLIKLLNKFITVEANKILYEKETIWGVQNVLMNIPCLFLFPDRQVVFVFAFLLCFHIVTSLQSDSNLVCIKRWQAYEWFKVEKNRENEQSECSNNTTGLTSFLYLLFCSCLHFARRKEIKISLIFNYCIHL